MKALLLFVIALCKFCTGEDGLVYSDIWAFGSIGKGDVMLLKQNVEERYVGPRSSSETEFIFPDPDENPQFKITFIGFTNRPHLHNVKIQSGGINRDRVNLLISRQRMHPKNHKPMGELVIYGRHKSC